jgi:DNA primase catalytic core
MAKIAQTEIERLKSEVSLLRLVESSGVVLKRMGKDWHGCCPFHEDKTPSLVITEDKNLWHCLGACQTGGTVIDWVMKTQGVSFRHAVELLREDSSLAAAVPGVKRSTVRKLPPPVSLDADDQALLRQVIDYYHDTLKQSPEALDYLKARGLDHPEVIDRFKLGFANRTLGLRLPDKKNRSGGALRGALQRIGIVRASGHEHFNGSLVIPVLDADGSVTEIYGRKIRDDLRAGTPAHLYLPGPHRGVFNLEALQVSKEIILCEALIDALTFWCAGFRNVTATYGVEGFTEDHLAAFREHGIERVLIAFDRDEAGERSAEKVAATLMSAGIDCFRIQFPKGMDANQYALKLQPAAKSLGLVIRKAVWLGKGAAPARTPARADAAPADAAPVLAPEPVSPLAAAPPAPAPEPAPVLPAVVMPDPPAPEAAAEVTDSEVTLRFDDRRWRVRGLPKNLAYDTLKVNLLVACGEAFHVDTLDLYSARGRAGFIAQAATELHVRDDVIKTDLGRVLRTLESLQDEMIRKALTPAEPAAVTMEDAARVEALALLKAPDLLGRIVSDLTACGLVGEDTNKLVAYLAATSRLLDAPLAVMVRASSAAGKSSLMEAVLALMPEEQRVKYSAMTGQALFYLGETNLKHKILALAEEEGAHRASYALKLLQSEGELTMASTGKDPVTGNLVTQEYRVEGPVMLMTTTTAAELDDELLNRCLVLSVDEGRTQTQAIHVAQRRKRTLDGIAAKDARDAIRHVHRNAQRLLRPLAVLNPYAGRLTFPDSAPRLRRDHEKYLSLIDTIALLHQHQREVKTLTRNGRVIEYLEATAADLVHANALAHDVLGRSLDELPPQTRSLLKSLCAWVDERSQALQQPRSEFHFSRRQVREHVGWGDTQLRLHLDRLVQLEYLLVHRGSRGQSFVYELLYDGPGDAQPHLSGLLDAAHLAATTPTSRGPTLDLAGSTRPPSGANAAGSRGAENAADAGGTEVFEDEDKPAPKPHLLAANGKTRSYPPVAAIAAGR